MSKFLILEHLKIFFESLRDKLSPVAFSGNYEDLNNTPDLNLADVAHTGDYDDLENKPTLATVATSGSYNDLSNKPTIPTAGDYVTAGKKAGTTLGTRATAEGLNTTASAAEAHAEGTTTEAAGSFSHAEGEYTKALGNSSHAEGNNTKASGFHAHAEGNGTEASGSYTHAEGTSTVARGPASHAEGYGTIARFKSSHVFGEFNQIDEYGTNPDARGRYVEIVGNGTNFNSRSNARTLTWTGDETLKGTLTVSSAGITIGNTTISEEQLQALLALLPIDQGGNEVNPPDESGPDQGESS